MTPDLPTPSARPERRVSNTPVPDPTVLTTEALHREAGRLEQLIGERIESLGILVDEKFRSVNQQLDLVERQRVEQKQDTKAAVDAALIAQKEAVKEQTIASEKAILKSELSLKDQLNQIMTTFATAQAGTNAAMDDLKGRVGKIEAIKVGGSEAKASIYGVAGFILTIVLIISAVAAFNL